MEDQRKKVDQVYQEVQLLRREETSATVQEMQLLSENWKDRDIPALQRKVVDVQLHNLRMGIVDPVFSSLAAILKKIRLQQFTLLDSACASGYYSEVIRTLDTRPIQYHGCDYSDEMILAARSYYPSGEFEVQNLTDLRFADQSFDVVLASGVLEHIPDYQMAILELCRVSRKYIVLHRCPLVSGSHHEFTIGSQYNIETPRIRFSKRILMKDFAARRFRLLKKIDVYPQEGRKSLRSLVSSVLKMNQFLERSTQTFLFKRI
jgi:ubiquinone/menaquinone biosynthesis C-methylase UbiE